MKLFSRMITGAFVLMLTSLFCTSCYYTAGPDFSINTSTDSTAKQETSQKATDFVPSQEQHAEEAFSASGSVDENLMTAESFFLRYVPHIYASNEEFHYYASLGDSEADGAVDLFFQLSSVSLGTQALNNEFDFLSDEDKDLLSCADGEELIYYTILIRAGEEHNPAALGGMIDASIAALCTVDLDNPKGTYRELGLWECPFFSPMDFYKSSHDQNKLLLNAGEEKEIIYVEKVRTVDLSAPLFLVINPGGAYYFGEDAHDPDDLSDEERNSIGIYYVFMEGDQL